MGQLSAVTGDAGLRARRWDAVVIGSGLASLTAAARLGIAGHRVLVVEEQAARDAHPALREPFCLTGARQGGPVELALRELSLALIERRRIVSHPLAYQIVGPGIRMDVGEAARTTEELAIWGIAKPEASRALVRSLEGAAEAERLAMLTRVAQRGPRRSGGDVGQPHARGLPTEASTADPPLARLLDVQIRALSNLATSTPTPEARARLLGAPLLGGAGFEDGPPWLSGLLRRRVESLYGEFRSVPGELELVSTGNEPGVRVSGSGELWLGRVLVMGAPPATLRAAMKGEQIPAFDAQPPVRARRVAVHLRTTRASIPEGMGPRVILLGDTTGDPIVTLATFPRARSGERSSEEGDLDLVARAVVPLTGDAARDEAAMDECGRLIQQRVHDLMPFADTQLQHPETHRPRWDDDDWLEDPRRGAGWPDDGDLKVSTRPPVYRLDRASVAGLGVEGDLLLGWQAGDAIARDLG